MNIGILHVPCIIYLFKPQIFLKKHLLKNIYSVYSNIAPVVVELELHPGSNSNNIRLRFSTY